MEGVPPTKKGLFPVAAQIGVDHGANPQDFAGVKRSRVFHLKNIELQVAFFDFPGSQNEPSGISVRNKGQGVDRVILKKRVSHRNQDGFVANPTTDIGRIIGVADDFGDFHLSGLGVLKEFFPRIGKFAVVFTVGYLCGSDLLQTVNNGRIASVPLLFETQRFGHGFDGFVGEPNNQTQKNEFEDVLEVHKADLPCNITNNTSN